MIELKKDDYISCIWKSEIVQHEGVSIGNLMIMIIKTSGQWTATIKYKWYNEGEDGKGCKQSVFTINSFKDESRAIEACHNIMEETIKKNKQFFMTMKFDMLEVKGDMYKMLDLFKSDNVPDAFKHAFKIEVTHVAKNVH
ncbi:MAG TPA: hypothetical protein VGK47_04540 [Nitrososphaeraceae archaeon]